MDVKKSTIYIGQGVLRGFLLTLILLIVYSCIAYFTMFNAQMNSVFFVIVTALSVMYGTLYSVKKIQKKGWIVGFGVSICYILTVFLISGVSGRGFNITSYEVLRMTLSILVGVLSGMLGVNI